MKPQRLKQDHEVFMILALIFRTKPFP